MWGISVESVSRVFANLVLFLFSSILFFACLLCYLHILPLHVCGLYFYHSHTYCSVTKQRHVDVSKAVDYRARLEPLSPEGSASAGED